MLCRRLFSTKIAVFIIFIGMILMAFGLVSHQVLPEENHSLNMFMGMITGSGFVFTIIGVYRFIHVKLTSPEKLKKEIIEQTDERKILIMKSSCSTAMPVAVISTAVMAFIFVFLGYITASFITIGFLYLQLITLLISVRHFNKHM